MQTEQLVVERHRLAREVGSATHDTYFGLTVTEFVVVATTVVVLGAQGVTVTLVLRVITLTTPALTRCGS